MASLEGWGSAIELHPQSVVESKRDVSAVTESGRQDSNLRSSAPKADALAATLRPGRAFADECRTDRRNDQSSCLGPARRFGRPELAP
jgi:hypothetical protein